MKKSIWSTGFVTIVLVLALAGCNEGPRPNVILISLDTLRADHLGTYGYSRPTSPFLDDLATRGTLFETALVQVPGTLPSHMSIFTGLYPNEHGVFPPDGALGSNIPTLPEVLHDAGYATAGFTEGGYVAGHYGFDRGFDVFDDDVPKLCNDIEIVFSRGLKFLRKQTSSRPFFLFLHTYAVHDPYFPPLPYTTRYIESMEPPSSFEHRFSFYRHSEMPLMTPERENEHGRIYKATRVLIEEGLPPGADPPTGPFLAAKNEHGPGDVSPEALAYYVSLYDASINYVDDVLASFFGSLESLDLMDDTIVIITADHGEEFLEHGKMTHSQVYQECLRVPLIILTPDNIAGSRVAEIVRSIDLAPTILELTGTTHPTRMTGVSLTPLMGTVGDWDRLESYASDAGNASRSLHVDENRLLQTVVHQPGDDGPGQWYSRTAQLSSNRTEISFRAMSFHSPREVEVSVDGKPLTTLSILPTWGPFSLSIGGESAERTFVLQTPGCDVPAEIGDSDDLRCLSFRIAGFPQQRTELFDLDIDPTGTTNIVNGEPETGAEMVRRMGAYDVSALDSSSVVDLSPEDVERLKSLGYLQ